MNMSYCRFRNTLQDLRDCQENLWDDELEPDEDEFKARKRLIEVARQIVEDSDNDPEFFDCD